jgi:hypothetical protein
MFHLARIALESREMLESIVAIGARVSPCGQAPPQLSLFDGTAASRRAAVAATIARLQAALRREEVVTMVPAPTRSRLPERMQQATPIDSPRDLLDEPSRGRLRTKRNGVHSGALDVLPASRAQVRAAERGPTPGAWAPALRLVEPPKPIAVPPPTAARAGPFRLSESWWEHPVERDYYQLVDNAGALLLVFRDLRDGCWYLQGVFD